MVYCGEVVRVGFFFVYREMISGDMLIIMGISKLKMARTVLNTSELEMNLQNFTVIEIIHTPSTFY